MISFLKKVINKFKYAFMGLIDGIAHDSSIALQWLIGLVVIIFCLFLDMNLVEYSIIIICIGLVIALEYINSAIETICDMICEAYDERIKKIKDYASGAVLCVSIASAIVAMLLIATKLF